MTRRSQADDEFGCFVADSYVGLVRFGALLVGERAGGEDVAQTALMKVYGSWSRIEDKEAAGAYTRKAMVRVAERGRRRRWSGEQPTAIGPDELVTLDRTDEVAVADLVGRALAVLPVQQRAVLVLRYFEACSEAEIAVLLGISAGTVKSRASRGLEALRRTGLLVDEHLTKEDIR